MDKYLLDTSIWIEVLRPHGRESLRKWVREGMLQGNVFLAPPVKMELLIGAKGERQYEALQKRLDVLNLLNDEGKVWNRAAFLGNDLRRKGITVPLMDILIAAWALEGDCVLVHQDRHYEMITPCCGLRTRSYLRF